MPTTRSYCRFTLEPTYALGLASVGASHYHYIDPLTPGLSVEQNTIETSPRWGTRMQRRPIAGRMSAGGTMSMQLHPEQGISLIYAAFGTLDTPVVNGDGSFTNSFVPGNTQRSIYYEEYLRENDTWLCYPGLTVATLTFNGNGDDAVVVDYDFQGGGLPVADASKGVITPVWFLDVDPFTGVIGTIMKEGSVFASLPEWTISISFGPPPRAPEWGSRAYRKACVGTVDVTLEGMLYFDTTLELREFQGDITTDITTTAIALQNGLHVVDDFNFEMQTDQYCDAAGTTRPYEFNIYLPRVTYESRGEMQVLDDCIRMPITGKAHYDPHDGYSVMVDVTNRLNNLEITQENA